MDGYAFWVTSDRKVVGLRVSNAELRQLPLPHYFSSYFEDFMFHLSWAVYEEGYLWQQRDIETLTEENVPSLCGVNSDLLAIGRFVKENGYVR